MLTFRDMTAADRGLAMPMIEDFYHTDAVLHPVSRDVLERSFDAAADPENHMLRGVLIFVDGAAAGYLYLTTFFSAEVGGVCVMIEEVYLAAQFRGKGLGGQVMAWIKGQFPHARRFRLEVSQSNPGAVRLYQKCGYQWLRYDQMVLDREEEERK